MPSGMGTHPSSPAGTPLRVPPQTLPDHDTPFLPRTPSPNASGPPPVSRSGSTPIPDTPQMLPFTPRPVTNDAVRPPALGELVY